MSMTLELLLPDSARIGEAVPITLRLTNMGKRPTTLYSQGRPTAFDIVVSQPNGRLVWHRLNRAVISSVLQLRTLAPGELLEFTDTWRQRDDAGRAVPAGDYQVTGLLPTDPPSQLRSRDAVLRILP